MDNLIQRINDAIVISENRSRGLAKSDDFMIPFLQCVREYDFEYVVHETLGQQNVPPSDSEITNRLYFQYGLPKLVQLYHETERPDHEGLHYVSTPELRDYARKVLYLTGYTEYLQRALHMVKDGLIQLEERDGVVTFVFHKRHYDSVDFMSESRALREEHDEIAELLHHTMTNLKPTIIQDVDENVRLFHERLIAYESTPLLDDFFMIKATTLALAMVDQNVFDPQANFGGLPFEAYALAVSMQTMFALKHNLCVQRLVAKHPELSMPDCFTVTASRKSVRDGLGRGFSAYGHSQQLRTLANDCEDLELILEVISAGRVNSRSLIGTNGVLPHLIELTPKSFIRCRQGGLHNPFSVLRRGLARRFPSDYSKAQQGRETRQLEQIKHIITKRFPKIQMKSNIKLRDGKRVLTDLDAVLVDSETRNVYFIQLKHQDPYGLDIRNRRQKADKLISEVDAWLKAIERWSKTVDMVRFLRDCGFKFLKGVDSLTLSVQVVSMHHAHFLANCEGPEFKYETWHGYIDALKKANTLQSAVASMRSSKAIISNKEGWERPFIVPEGTLEGITVRFIDETA